MVSRTRSGLKRRREWDTSKAVEPDYEFVEPPPKQLQSECPICLEILCEPHLISCCGHSFCAACIECVKKDGKPCPFCNEPTFTTMANKGLKRMLDEIRIYCPHRLGGCKWVGKLGKRHEHLDSDPQLQCCCPCVVVRCELHHVGCEVILPRKDMADHMKNHSIVHISLLSKRLLEREEQMIKQSQELTKVARELQELRSNVEMQQVIPVTIKVTGFEALKKKGSASCSRPFYTVRPDGYKMCLKVYANGCGAGRGTHVSVYTCLVHGEFDSRLKWPFRGTVTIQLVNQLEDKEHHTETICYTDGSHGERTYSGWGSTKFISHAELDLSKANNRQYLKDDCLSFHIL